VDPQRLEDSWVMSDSENPAGVEFKGYRTSAGETLEDFLTDEIIPLDERMLESMR